MHQRNHRAFGPEEQQPPSPPTSLFTFYTLPFVFAFHSIVSRSSLATSTLGEKKDYSGVDCVGVRVVSGLHGMSEFCSRSQRIVGGDREGEEDIKGWPCGAEVGGLASNSPPVH